MSAGFDAHRNDPLAGICLSSECYNWMTQRASWSSADHHARGRIVSLLEGGYNLRALPECIAKHPHGAVGLSHQAGEILNAFFPRET
ncbi:MAG: hypothetical protein U5P41_16165 [Gammaproteobacteria bacterium]|nr:hypothetical protein [Gammaproteobacteria bacterium]